MNKCVNLNRQIVGYFVVLILLLSLATTIQNFANAQETSGYTEITPQQAYTMINRHHSQNVLVLDVRNESEYSFAHLYGALQIPCYQLEDLIDIYRANPNATIIDYRSVKLMTHINDLIIVYCEKGSRSAIACNILSQNGFSHVYNIAGGIDAWLQSNHPIYNTAHNVTVSGNGQIITKPWTAFKCTCETQGNLNNNSEIQNYNLEIINQTADFAQATISFEFNNIVHNNTISTTTLWNYTHNNHGSNITATLELINSVGTLNLQYYLLKYQIGTDKYNFSAASTFQSLDYNTYNNSVTIVKFLPIGKSELLSIEQVNFTAPVTLS